MQVLTGHSEQDDIQAALQEACAAFRREKPVLLLFFSDSLHFQAAAEGLKRMFPGTKVAGASTHASFGRDGLCRRGINIAAFSGGLRVSAGIIREITRHPGMIYRDIVEEAIEGLRPASLTPENTCCLVLNPAGTASEELVLDTLTEALQGTDIPIFGGSASSEECVCGDVTLDGKTFANSSVFLLLHLDKGRFHIQQENIFKPMGSRFTATKTDAARRTLYELNGEPAADVLCRELHTDDEGLPAALAAHPFGRIIDGELYIDEVERVNPDRSITTYCRILAPSEVVLLELCDFPATMRQTLDGIHGALKQVDFSLLVNCFSRTQLFLQKGWMETFSQTMNQSLGSYIGLTSHGEQLGSFQLNLTLLVLSFGDTEG